MEQIQKTNWLKIVLVTAVVAITVSALTVWLISTYLFPKQFRPTHLSAKEEQVLENKLNRLSPQAQKGPSSQGRTSARLSPQAYRESEADREISLTERELNGLLARNTDLAQKLAIDLSDNLASASLLLPLEPDLPVLGGKTLRVTAGLELRYAGQKPVVILRGISIWGVPIPSAWLGGIKNIDLVEQFGGKRGFWQAFSKGVADIRVQEGRLLIRLKE
jgi:hypothetical protein